MANPNRNRDLSAPLSDVASFSQNYTLDAYAAVPVVQANLLKDLAAHELRLASPYGGTRTVSFVLLRFLEVWEF